MIHFGKDGKLTADMQSIVQNYAENYYLTFW